MKTSSILEANQYVHKTLVLAGEYQKSPHFLPENIERVGMKLATEVLPLISSPEVRAIDFGCGTGFMIDLLVDVVKSVDGIDITQEMLDEVDLSSGKVSLSLAPAEQTPFTDNQFDLATAYSFLDHLADVEVFLREVFRVLKPGGVFYTGLNPNQEFAERIKSAARNAPQAANENPILEREILSMLYNGSLYETQFGIEKDVLELAETIKTKEGGFNGYAIKKMALELGFTSAHLTFDWFLGQASFKDKPADVTVINQYLENMQPASSPLFKYLNLVLVK